MEWVYCNKCFLLIDKVSIHLTSCCHLLCKKCLKKQCAICNKTIKSVEINDKMPPSVAYYFEDIGKSISKLKKTIKFQWEQRSRYEEEKCRSFEEIRKMKKMKEEVEKSIRNHEETIRQECKKIKKFRDYVTQCQNSRKENTMFQTPPRPSRRHDAHPYSSGSLQQIDMNSSSSSSAGPRNQFGTPTFFGRNSTGARSINLRNNLSQGNRSRNSVFRGDDTGYHTPAATNTMSSRHRTLESLRFQNLF